jgi:hypothetical protein
MYIFYHELNKFLQAWKNWKAGTTSDIVDPILDQGFNKNEKIRSIHVGLLSVQEDIDMRPAMSQVIQDQEANLLKDQQVNLRLQINVLLNIFCDGI